MITGSLLLFCQKSKSPSTNIQWAGHWTSIMFLNTSTADCQLHHENGHSQCQTLSLGSINFVFFLFSLWVDCCFLQKKICFNSIINLKQPSERWLHLDSTVQFAGRHEPPDHLGWNQHMASILQRTFFRLFLLPQQKWTRRHTNRVGGIVLSN